MAVTARQISENIAYYIGRNKIINGKMEIAQRGTSFASSPSTSIGLDRYKWRGGFTDYTTSRDTSVPDGFLYSLKVAANTAATVSPASSIFEQRIEGYNVRDLIGQTFVTSFWVKASKTGTYCVSFRNSTSDRSYVVEYTISAANTWEYKFVVVPGGLITAGTWNWENGIGLIVSFSFCGLDSALATTANSWQTAQYFYTSNQANAFDTIGGNFAITGVQLEAGATPTNFEHRPYGLELALCQRYYNRIPVFTGFTGFAILSTQARFAIPLPTNMRDIPSVFQQSGTAANYTVVRNGGGSVTSNAVPTLIGASPSSATVRLDFASGLVAGEGLQSGGVAGSFLGFEAEL